MEFHVSKKVRDLYEFDLDLFSLKGDVVFANFYAARSFADRINKKKDLKRHPEQAVQASKINAMGLIDEILHFVIEQYTRQIDPHALAESTSYLDDVIGRTQLNRTLLRFCEEFPPLDVYRQSLTAEEYLHSSTNGIPNRQLAVEEMVLLWLANINPAFSPYIELFEDTRLSEETFYQSVSNALNDFFSGKPPFGPDEQNLLEMLHSPAVRVPYSLEGQLSYILERWGYLLGSFRSRLLSSLDFIQEEDKAVFLGQGMATVPDFQHLEGEIEQYSIDRDWMPQVVLIAKNAFVWLNQLSKIYQKDVTQLNHVPDEELRKLQEWGITGLWLIGVWERSPASRRIKNLTGSPDAIASAYSLFEYGISDELGGEAAYKDLRERAWRYGIRLASDMVPNHMGIDSPWVIEHPDWFISLDETPFPSYSFNGPDLSSDGRAGIFIEDHYYDRTDAAVVFHHVSRDSGRGRYIYHGNDGTSMPWNDTAQINFLNPAAREAVIQTILSVARKFPIIRFDAAMTLTKRHYQRLWFPEPGTGGAIPSRAGFGMDKNRFDELFPVEFWREVVDRVADEVPDTLLLAEAFWLTEGYFVRTLGMHRVYNSAFMNMLRDEDNANYRSLMKKTLEFDPEILKRYVNFMNNPDERTAVDQFGKGDKYFGICLLMATMPGLPMFGHGQIEGFTEKYGMEFRRPAWDEDADLALISRHEREIFPLLHRRWLFAGVEDFLLYDFYGSSGKVNEDVFAYSNRVGDESALVVYQNKFAETSGWIRTSAGFIEKASPGDLKPIVQKTIGEGLGLQGNSNGFCLFRDQVTGLEYIRSSREIIENGIFLELRAYEAHVFYDFRQVESDNSNRYEELSRYLNGRGVPNLEEARTQMLLLPVRRLLADLLARDFFNRINQLHLTESSGITRAEEAGVLENRLKLLLDEMVRFSHSSAGVDALANEITMSVASFLAGPDPLQSVDSDCRPANLLDKEDHSLSDEQVTFLLYTWLLTRSLVRVISQEPSTTTDPNWIDEWKMTDIVLQSFYDMGFSQNAAANSLSLLKILTTQQGLFSEANPDTGLPFSVLNRLTKDRDTSSFLGVNWYDNKRWLSKDALEELLCWLQIAEAVSLSPDTIAEPRKSTSIEETKEILDAISKSGKDTGYQVDLMLEQLSVLKDGMDEGG